MTRFFGLLFVALVIYYKPLYLLSFFLFFFIEYLFLIKYLIRIFSSFNGEYCIIEIKRFDVSNANLFLIWVHISDLSAFKRVYLMISKKKIRFPDILFYLFVFLFNIPLRFLKLSYDFFFSKKNWRDWFEIRYSNLYYETKDLKIEILDNKIYLNCFTLGKLINEFRVLKPNVTAGECFRTVIELKKVKENLEEYERDEEKIKMVLGKIKNNESFITNRSHYTIIEKSNSIHQTSNIDFCPFTGQRFDASLPSLTKPNSIKPGTVITRNIIFVGNNNYVWVPKKELTMIKFNHLDLFDLPKNELIYLERVDSIFAETIKVNLSISFLRDRSLLNDIKMGHYNLIINGFSDKELISGIEKVLPSNF